MAGAVARVFQENGDKRTTAAVAPVAGLKLLDRMRMTKRATCRTFRDCFATRLLESGYDIGTMQELLGHKDAKTTMIYTHVLNRGGKGVTSPVENL